MNVTVVEGGRARGCGGGCDHGAHGPGIKVCPQCGATLFDDMDTCYGCLYAFGGQGAPAAARLPAPPAVSPGAGGYGAGWAAGADWRDELVGYDPGLWDDGFCEADADVDEADETGDLSELAGSPRYRVVLEWRGVRAPVTVPAAGLSVGRASDNDVVLRAAPVSRHHVRVVQEDGAVLVCDAGASHAATLDGEEVRDCAPWLPGSVLDVCGARFSLEMLDPRG